jgi:hypothetical protein
MVEVGQQRCQPGDVHIPISAVGTAINANSYLFRILKEAGRQASIDDVTHQMLRRTCST